jgi:NAD+ kinase
MGVNKKAMIIGIVPNISKSETIEAIPKIISELQKNEINFYLSELLLIHKEEVFKELPRSLFLSFKELGEKCNMVISIGGDGTMLNTAFEVRDYSTPILGLNFGKLGFLAEFDIESFGIFAKEIKEKKYIIEERMALIGLCNNDDEKLYAINDLVIDKGPWPKMIELTLKIDDDYVSTFSADGIIIATPTGSTGYSLSAGGPIVNPKADVITLSPIAPHTLTIRPLVISSNQNISVIVNSPYDRIQVACDGQRVNFYKSPVTITIQKHILPFRLVLSSKANYFETLRTKLLWGLDVRKSNNL